MYFWSSVYLECRVCSPVKLSRTLLSICIVFHFEAAGNARGLRT